MKRRGPTVADIKSSLAHLPREAATAIGGLDVRVRLAVLRHDFRKEGNPLFAWEAWRLCRERGAGAPAWVLEQLDVWAEKLLSLSSASDVAKALGLANAPGESSPFTELTLFRRDQKLALAVDKKLQAGVKEPRALMDVAASEDVSEKTVRRAWDRFREDLESDLLP